MTSAGTISRPAITGEMLPKEIAIVVIVARNVFLMYLPFFIMSRSRHDSTAFTVVFRLISNQMIPVFTGMLYLDFNFIIQSVNIGSRPEYASVSPRLRIQDRSSAVLSLSEECPVHRNLCLASAFLHNYIQNSIHGNTSFQSSSGRIRGPYEAIHLTSLR